MDYLEPEPGFYESIGYGQYEKKFIHNATVSMLNIKIYNSKAI